MDLTIYDQTSSGISQDQHDLVERVLQFAAQLIPGYFKQPSRRQILPPKRDMDLLSKHLR